MRCEKQQLGIFITFAVMIVVFVIRQYLPLRNSARAVEQVKAALLSAGTKTDLQVRNLPILRTQLKELQAKVGNYDVQIPDDRGLGAFLQEIAAVMNKHNLSEQVVQPENEIKIDGLTCIPVRMQCKGTTLQLFEFFKSLGTVERLMRIEQVQMKNASDLSGLVTMAAKVNIYYREPKQRGGSQ